MKKFWKHVCIKMAERAMDKAECCKNKHKRFKIMLMALRWLRRRYWFGSESGYCDAVSRFYNLCIMHSIKD